VFIGEVEDGAECISMRSRGSELDLPPIVAVDHVAKTIRDGMESQPFPAKWYRAEDVQWTKETR
jgi:hypothetical protein